MAKQESTSEIIESVINIETQDSGAISIYEIKTALHEKGFVLMLLIFSAPLSIPLPVPPGFTTIASLPLLFFSIQMLLGFDSPWLPKYVTKRSIKKSSLAKIIEKTSPILKKIERLMKPRISILSSYYGEKFYAFLCLICTISIAIPLPLTNFIPAGGIAVMSLGLISKDGVFIILGIITSFVGLIISTLVMFLGASFVTELFSFISS